MVKHISDDNIGVALWGLGLVLLELGLQRLPRRLRYFAYPVAAMAFIATLGHAHQPREIRRRRTVAAAASAQPPRHDHVGAPHDRLAGTGVEVGTGVSRAAFSGAGLLFALIALWVAVPDEFVPAAWALLAIAVLFAGNALDVLTWRLEAHAIAVFAAFSAFPLAIVEAHPHRLQAVALLIAAHIGLRFLSAVATGLRTAGRSYTKVPQAFSPPR